jgi:hypothetical protein
MTANEAIEIIKKATEGNYDCKVAISVIHSELDWWQNHREKLEVTLEKAVKSLVSRKAPITKPASAEPIV